MKVTVTFRQDGSIEYVHAQPSLLEDLGAVSRRRAGHVEPVNRLLRWLFHVIRSRIGDESLVAAFTRMWPCRWQSNLAPCKGPILGPFARRDRAITAEVAWVERHVLN